MSNTLSFAEQLRQPSSSVSALDQIQAKLSLLEEDMLESMDSLKRAASLTEEAVSEYHNISQSIAQAKSQKYLEVTDPDDSLKQLIPVKDLLTKIETETSVTFDYTARTKDEREKELKAHLLKTNKEYANLEQQRIRAEFTLINLEQRLNATEKDYGRSNALLWALKSQIEGLTSLVQGYKTLIDAKVCTH